ncbi:MAG: DNA/RNA nuclease SfsA [Deltaproteobacteria bacterium]|nr:MAG: DNA/RNA nuclease SfsA [Deltaproteobacteria bacterium]
MPFPTPILRGRFIKREKRFLAHMEMESGARVIAHCANTGSMRGSLREGAPTLMWDSKNPKRKYTLSWKAIQLDNTWIGIDTSLPNALVAEAISMGFIGPLAGYATIQRERKISDESRIDIYLTDGEAKDCYVEVKNVTLVEDGVARFPDAVTTSGLKHLGELMKKVGEGERAAMVYVIQRGDGYSFKPADDIDPLYGKKLREAHSAGVEVYALSTEVSEKGVEATGLLPIKL